jgi:SAM-dependent methyltransferase
MTALRGDRSTSHVPGAGERWEEGLDEEVEYWERWMREPEASPWPEEWPWRTDPESPLQPHIREHLDPDLEELRILDVGSGPLTILGKRWGDRTLHITAVDPLADRYAALFERLGIEPLVRPVPGEAERLTETFAADSFDLVYARNCLDHGYDPLLAIRQMLRVARPGGLVFLEHATDEGEHMRYAGPHQWNFRAEAGRFVIWRPGLRVDAHALLEEHATIETAVTTEAPPFLRVMLRKHR